MKGLVVVVSVFSVLFWLASCAPTSSQTIVLPTPTPSLLFTWDTVPDVRMMLATYCCDSPTTEALVRFYIPEAQLWGDGRLLWTEQDEGGMRQVFVTRLSTNEVQALLQEIAAAGFWEWDTAYQGEPAADATGKCLTLTLTDQERTVCEAHGGAPAPFHTLFDRLSQGAGQRGMLLQPESAYVTGFELKDLVGPRPAAVLTWEQLQVPGPAIQILSGFWIEEEETLLRLWNAANQDTYRMPIVEDGDNLYRLILQVPGVSWLEPQG